MWPNQGLHSLGPLWHSRDYRTLGFCSSSSAVHAHADRMMIGSVCHRAPCAAFMAGPLRPIRILRPFRSTTEANTLHHEAVAFRTKPRSAIRVRAEVSCFYKSLNLDTMSGIHYPCLSMDGCCREGQVPLLDKCLTLFMLGRLMRVLVLQYWMEPGSQT